MIKSEHILSVAQYDSIEELHEADAWLLNEARATT